MGCCCSQDTSLNENAWVESAEKLASVYLIDLYKIRHTRTQNAIHVQCPCINNQETCSHLTLPHPELFIESNCSDYLQLILSNLDMLLHLTVHLLSWQLHEVPTLEACH